MTSEAEFIAGLRRIAFRTDYMRRAEIEAEFINSLKAIIDARIEAKSAPGGLQPDGMWKQTGIEHT